MEQNLNDYQLIAYEFTEFKTTTQKIEAREKLEEYIRHIAEIDPIYTTEIIKLIKNDKEFEEQMLISVPQLACLLTSTIIETVFKYDVVFDVVKKKTAKDYVEVKLFKQYLLNTFSINEIEEEIGYDLSDNTLQIFEGRFEEIVDYFTNY